MNEEIRWVLLNMTEEQQLACHDALVIYAERRCRKWRWPTGNSANMPGGVSPEDIEQEAWKRFLCGERNWKFEVNPEDEEGNISKATVDSLMKFMKGAIDSLVSDFGHSGTAKTYASLEDECTRTNDQGERYEVELKKDNVAASFSAPVKSSDEQAVFYKELDRNFRKAIADRPDLSQ